MTFKYDVLIKTEDDDKDQEIHFSKDEESDDTIQGVEFLFNSDDNSRDRDKNARVELRITGRFNDNPDTLKALVRLGKWSLKKTGVYRTVQITAETDEDSNQNFIRTYKFDKMFCLDYKESIEAEGLTFEVFLAQHPQHSTCDIDGQVI